MDYEKIGGVRRRYDPNQAGDEIALRLPYNFILEAILDTVRRNVDRIGRLILVPQMYIVHLNPEDRGWRLDKEDIVISELVNELAERRAEFSNPQTEAEPFHIEFADDEELEHFEIAVSFKLVAPRVKQSKPPVIAQAPAEKASGLKPLNEPPVRIQPVKEPTPGASAKAAAEAGATPKRPKSKPVEAEPIHAETLSVALYCDQKLVANRALERDEPFMIGRSFPPAVDLHIEDASGEVSGKHIQLLWTGDQIECVILGDNGCKINDVEFDEGSSTVVDEKAAILIEGRKNKFQLVFSRES